jgi:hypothetical protein
MSKKTSLGKAMRLLNSVGSALTSEMLTKNNEYKIADVPDQTLDELSEGFAKSVSEAANFFYGIKGAVMDVDLCGLSQKDFEPVCRQAVMLSVADLRVPIKIPSEMMFVAYPPNGTWKSMFEHASRGNNRPCAAWELLCFGWSIRHKLRYIPAGWKFVFVDGSNYELVCKKDGMSMTKTPGLKLDGKANAHLLRVIS